MTQAETNVSAANLASIYQHREAIDQIDRKLVALLNERAIHSLTIRNLKPGAGMDLFDPSREDAIYEKVCNLNDGPLTDDNLKEIYATMLKVMKEAPSLPTD